MLNIVIPMAGEGRRFQDAGYTTSKPFLPVGNRRMIDAVIENIRPKRNHRFVFIHRADQEMPEDSFPKNSVFIPVKETTEGAACTVLLAREYLDTNEPLMIANSDQIVDVDIDDFLGKADQEDGLIMVFPADDPKWSYAKVDPFGRVTRVAEKLPISRHATVGIYYFADGRDFVRAADAMIEKNDRCNGEFYVCPIYNHFIGLENAVGIYAVKKEQMHGLGTPEDYEAYCRDLF